MTPTIIQGPPPGVGVPQSNVIPALAETTLDIRLTPGIDADGIRAELEASAATRPPPQPGIKVEWEPVNAFRLATKVDRSEALVEAMVRGVQAGDAAGPPRYGGVPARPTARSSGWSWASRSSPAGPGTG